MSRDYVLRPFRPAHALAIDYARDLNPQQHAAVTAPPGPALVIAGAGAGKTRTLIYRVAFLIEQGIPPSRILLLTFTNKAAREMMRRVADLLGGDPAELWGGTFHAIGHRTLRQHAPLLGFTRRFTILDREDQKDLLQASIGDAGIDVKAVRFPKPDVLVELFSLCANTGHSLEELLEGQFDYLADQAQAVRNVQAHYNRRKQANDVMDFDDLLILWLKLMRDFADVREQIQRRFEFVLVDEYQDTNHVQGELIDAVAARHKNVTAVGDDAQSIYSWRGADLSNILRFPERYPAAAIYKIETNYRSTPQILNLANAAIAANEVQFAKELSAVRPAGQLPAVARCATASEQAGFVAQRALELRDEGLNLGDMAVLYRSHFHALELQLELTRRNIPFSITSGIRFFEQAHIKDVAAYLKLVCNSRDELAFKRLVRLLPGIGGSTADKLWSCFLGRVGTAATSGSPIAESMQACVHAVPKKTASHWAQCVATIGQLEASVASSDTAKMIQLVVDAGYEDYLKNQFPNYRARLEDLQQLANFSRQFQGVDDFLSQLALLSDLEADDQKPVADDSERIRLSTVHQAKGLEFRVVFVIMLCDGLFPSVRSLESLEGEEEERRLFYVAVTRARDELYLCYPTMRFTRGLEGQSIQSPSRFLDELPEQVCEEWNLAPGIGF